MNVYDKYLADVYSNKVSLKDIQFSMKTEEICAIAVINQPDNWQYVPQWIKEKWINAFFSK